MADSVIPVLLGKLPHYSTMPLGGVLLMSVPDRQDASKKRFATLLPKGLTVGTINAPGGTTTGGGAIDSSLILTAVPANGLITLNVGGTINYISSANLYAGMVSGATGGSMAANGATVTSIPANALVVLSVDGSTNYITPSNLYAGMTGTATGSTHAESADGTTITDTSGAIYDAAGNKFSLITAVSPQTGLGVAYNGAYQSPTANVNLGLWYGHAFYQRNTAGTYYKWNGTSFDGATTDPRPQAEVLTVATPTAKTTGTAFSVTGTYANVTPTALDYSLNGGSTWTAATSPTISGGNFSFSITIATANASQTIKVRDRNAQTIIATSGTFAVAAPAKAESASGTQLTSSTGTIYDASLNAFTLAAAVSPQTGLGVYYNGAYQSPTGNVTLGLYYNHAFYQQNNVGNWYMWNGTTYVDATDPRVTTTTPATPGTAAGPGPTASSSFITVNCGSPTNNTLQPQLFGVAMASDVDFTPWQIADVQNAAKNTLGMGLPGTYARINSNDSSLNSDGSANTVFVDRVISAMPKIIDLATGEFTYNVGYANNNVWNTNPTQIAAGAKAIAQRFVNSGVVPQGYEIFNESNPDGGGAPKVPTAQYTPVFNACADAILSVQPNAKIIGPNDSFMATDRIGGLASAAGSRLGAFSYHIYAVDASVSDTDAFNRAISRASSDASRLRATAGAGTIPARLSEYNMDGNPPGDLRQLTIKGAVWNALILHSVFVNDSLHTHGAIWDWLGDGYYSQIIDPNNNPRQLTPYMVVPSGYMLKTARQYMSGKSVPITTAPSGNLKTLATVNGNRVSVWLINYDTSASFSGQIALSKWPVNGTGNGTVKMSQLNQSNATPLVASVAVTNGVTASVTLPPISVTVLTSAA